MIRLFLSTALFVAECLLCYVMLVLVLGPMLPFISVFYIFKVAERVIVKVTSGAFPLPSLDAVFVTEKDEDQANINALLCFENRGNVEDEINNIRQAILERLVDAKKTNGELLYPKVRCYFRPGWFQYFLQKDDCFKIEKHVFKWQGDVPSSKDELAAIVSKLSNEPLPEGRSPWYGCCIPTNFGDNDIVVMVKMNHAIADGISLARFLTQKFSDTVIPAKHSQNVSTTSRKLFLAKAALTTPRHLFKLLFSSADRSILHGPNLSGVKKAAWYEAFDLKLIKEIKTATGTTVNDVLMSCLSLALRRYSQRKGVKNPDDLTVSIPVNLRSSALSKELAFENNVSFIYPELAVATDGILKQLYETKTRMNEAKVSAEPLASAAVLFLSQELCPGFLTSKANNFLISKASCIFSNVPGPQQMLTVKGSRIKYMIFWPPHKGNTGVGLSIFTYAGHVIFGAYGDISVLSDPEIIVEEFGSAVNEMARCFRGHNNSCISNGQP
ncbi:putative diacyglycerol O-acyltransferase MT1809 [Montipora foliosa]|uniref:putative diacyglycerol O-acyltransferase MT1809 n=1 Tax=Montipora foliosa TaxID=591990 RepID=UPI0035F15122